MIDLTGFIPKKILDVSQDPRGFIVDDEDWNSRWNKNREQGDDTAQKLYETIQNLYESAWHPTAGAASIKNPALAPTSGLDVSTQLAWLAGRCAALDTAVANNAADILLRRLIATPITHAETTGKDGIDCHPISAITGLEERLTGIQAGALDAVSHNLLPERTAANAHPQSAITGLEAALTALDDAIDTQVARVYASTEITHGAISVFQKLANIDATIGALTGNMSEIVHNDLASRDAANAHPIGAITGLQTALDAKLASATAAATYQRQILHGNTAPLDTLGNDGDVYIKLAV